MDISILLNDKGKSSCPDCHKQFSTNRNALRHFTNIHFAPLVCKYCGKALKMLGRPDKMILHYQNCKPFSVYFSNINPIGSNIDMEAESRRLARMDYREIKSKYHDIIQSRFYKRERVSHLDLDQKLINFK
eukprot:NODE_611_length_6023_cov_0.126435.p4 type:complete len:131 gc:universal NODE_611_length_6023_cov_0.126435:3545-3153(-)